MSGTTNGGRDRGYQALRDSEALHRATLENISDAVFLANDEGAFTYICPNVDVIFGYVPDEVLARGTIGRFLGGDLFDPAELAARGEIRNLERDVVSKSGQIRTVLIHVKRVAIQDATVLCTCRDVTELRQAERELAATRVELTHAARLALAGELTASIVHELQQPLTSILANSAAGSRLAGQDGRHGEGVDLCEIFDDIHRVCRNALDSIERLRTLVRKRPLELQPLSINGVVEDVLRLVAADARRRQVALRAELAPLLPLVDADRVSIQQVIANLVVNAIEAAEHGWSDSREVVVRTRLLRGQVECEVSDSGPGLGSADVAKIFDAFFTTKKEGIGLGLSIARAIVEAHHGHIWTEALAGIGATFRVALPAIPEAHA